MIFSPVLPAFATTFSTDFDSGAPPEFTGFTTTESVQGYSGLGPIGNTFSGDFLRNPTVGPVQITTLTLTGLPAHSGVDMGFLLAVIDSWDGVGCNPQVSPDIFNVRVNGNLVFSEAFENSNCGTQSYSPPAGVELARHVPLGFNPGSINHQDSAYNMGLDPTFQGIPHTSSTLTIEWFSSGSGWQGNDDESWAIENVEINLLGVEPSLVGGEIIPIDNTALLLAGIQSSAIWMLPALAGIVGAGAFFVRTRMNKE